jgi:hypothetical protein
LYCGGCPSLIHLKGGVLGLISYARMPQGPILFLFHGDESLPPLYYTLTLTNEGAPGVGSTPGGLYPNRGNRSGQRIKIGDNEIKSPTRKPDAWGTQFILSLDVRSTRL